MRWFSVVMAVLGLAVSALGVLWVLQGSGLVHIDPILCVSDCVPVTGYQPRWQLAGAIALVLGLGVATTGAALRLRARARRA